MSTYVLKICWHVQGLQLCGWIMLWWRSQFRFWEPYTRFQTHIWSLGHPCYPKDPLHLSPCATILPTVFLWIRQAQWASFRIRSRPLQNCMGQQQTPQISPRLCTQPFKSCKKSLTVVDYKLSKHNADLICSWYVLDLICSWYVLDLFLIVCV